MFEQAGGPPLFVVPLGLKSWLATCGVRNAIAMFTANITKAANTRKPAMPDHA